MTTSKELNYTIRWLTTTLRLHAFARGIFEKFYWRRFTQRRRGREDPFVIFVPSCSLCETF